MSFTIILITTEQSFKLSFLVHVEVGNKKRMRIKLPPSNGSRWSTRSSLKFYDHKEMLYPMDH